MTEKRRYVLIALVALAASLAGVLLGRSYVAADEPVESELHAFVHERLDLDAQQLARIEAIEKRLALRREALELELRANNARLAEAIEAERGYGPKVSLAVDRSHVAMSELQKETLQHIFAMRSVMRPDQAARFDAAVTKALTAAER